MPDFLAIADCEPDIVKALVDRSLEVKRDPTESADTLAGMSVGLFFMKPSTRTRVSAEVGTQQLGAHPVVLKNEEVGLGGRETVEDVARVLDRYLDALAFRVFDHSDLIALAEYATAPVINLLSDLEHPCQAIADLVTVAEHLDVAGATLAYVGDGNNVCNSLMVGAAMLGMNVRVATPPGFEPLPAYVSATERYGTVDVTNNPAAAVQGADVVYTDVWASMGQESDRATRLGAFAGFTIDEDLFSLAAENAIFLHCLPAHRGEEVTSAVFEHSRSKVFDQAENRLHSFKAVLLHVMG